MPVENAAEQPKTLSDYARKRFKGLLHRIASVLLRVGLTPNTLTIAGLIGHIVGAIFISQGKLLIGGLAIFFLAPLDAFDGAMAKLSGETNRFGAFLDSVTDRYSEIFMYAGLLVYFLRSMQAWQIGMTLAALAGSIMVSYTRARAEGLGFELKIGFFTRLERYLVMVPSILLGVPWFGVTVVAVFANLTALQRIAYIWKETR